MLITNFYKKIIKKTLQIRLPKKTNKKNIQKLLSKAYIQKYSHMNNFDDKK